MSIEQKIQNCINTIPNNGKYKNFIATLVILNKFLNKQASLNDLKPVFEKLATDVMGLFRKMHINKGLKDSISLSNQDAQILIQFQKTLCDQEVKNAFDNTFNQLGYFTKTAIFIATKGMGTDAIYTNLINAISLVSNMFNQLIGLSKESEVPSDELFQIQLSNKITDSNLNRLNQVPLLNSFTNDITYTYRCRANKLETIIQSNESLNQNEIKIINNFINESSQHGLDHTNYLNACNQLKSNITNQLSTYLNKTNGGDADKINAIANLKQFLNTAPQFENKNNGIDILKYLLGAITMTLAKVIDISLTKNIAFGNSANILSQSLNDITKLLQQYSLNCDTHLVDLIEKITLQSTNNNNQHPSLLIMTTENKSIDTNKAEISND
ncbi:hypothetical protein L3V83_02240 [Thiotrichales bacterium 19X7-9]|nr:hypothetical protein [Thiotrichales bacterium 19X7-9]